MIYSADQNTVCFQYESGAYGSTLTSGSRASGLWIGLVTDHSPSDEENVTSIRYTGTSSRNVAQQINTSKDYEGTISYHPQDFRMFHFALGSITDAGSPTPYSHVISEMNNNEVYPPTSGANHSHTFPSFTVVDSHKGASDGEHQVRKYKGTCIDELELTISQGEPTTCELSYISQSLDIGSKSSDLVSLYDEDTSRPYIWSDWKIHKPSGTVLDNVTEAKWKVSNNLERRHYDNGSKVIDNLRPGNRNYELSLTLDADSSDAMTLYEDNWQSGETFNMMYEGVLSSGSETGYFIMSGCKITSFESPSPAEGIDEYNITIVPEDCIINSDDLIYKHAPW